MKLKDKTKKIISSLLIISILVPTVLFSQPKKAEAIPVIDAIGNALKAVAVFLNGTTAIGTTADTAISVKNVAKEIARQVLMTIARRALQEITKSTVNWINSGHWGSPLFLENPESFFKDIAKFEVKTMVDMFGYNPLKFPFGKDFALNTINSYKSQLENNMQYTLSTVMADEVLLKSYQNDFNVGGWNGFLINTQYPQNNYVGFQMLATEELARRIQGIDQNNVEKVQTILQQGQGFLSPQVCMDEGTKYNTVGNQFKKPSFNEAEYNAKNWHPPTDEGALEIYREVYTEGLDAAKAEWAKTNTCKNLVNTTPGSVVASQAMNAISSTFRTTELGVAMGNSLSAIFDAFLNKLIGSGLNALASKANPEPEKDDWSYDGQTLSGAYGNNNPWDVGADEPIILKQFKILLDGKTIKTTAEGVTTEEIGNVGGGEYIPGGIANTEKELKLVDDTIGLLGQIWPKSRELDLCIPGPDLGWAARTDKETQRNSAKLQEKANQDDPEKAAKAQLAYNELEYAVSFFKDWINNKMMLELPSSILFMDAVDEVSTLSQQSDEITKNRRIKSQALARLKAIKTALASITTQPVAGSGSAQEKVLVSLMKQYKATSNVIATTVSIGDAENALAVAKEKLAKLVQLVNQCKTERTVSGWTNPGGWSSAFSGRTEPCTENSSVAITTPLPSTMTPGQNYDFTIRVTNTGTSFWHHGDYFQFIPQSENLSVSPSIGWLPYAVSANFSTPSLRYADWTFEITAPLTPGNYSVALQMVHKRGGPYLKLLDDKKTPYGTDSCSNSTPTSDTSFGGKVTISLSVVGAQVRTSSPVISNPPSNPPGTLPPSPPGTEKELFCDKPIVGGFSHESFVQKGAVTHPLIPLVNGKDVLNWPRFFGIFGIKRVNIELGCNTIYRANLLDYKGNIPGLTTVFEPYEEMPPDTEDPGGECTKPTDADTKHEDPGAAAAVAAATAELRTGGMKWNPDDPDQPHYECNRFEILLRATKILEGQGKEVGLWSKTSGNNCQGYSVDIMSFPDGYLYDVLGGGDEGINATWGGATCEPIDDPVTKHVKASTVNNTNYPPD